MTDKPTYEELERRVQKLEKEKSALSLAEYRLKKIFNNSQDAIFIHNQEGKIFDINGTMCRMYRLTKEEALEVNIKDLSSSKMSAEILSEKWQKVLNGGKLLFEWEACRPKDKSVFNVEVSIQKINFHDQDFVLANVRDITERKRAEEAQRVREEKYRLLFNMGLNAMFLVDNNTAQILECNNKASKLLGYSSQELLSMKMTDLSTTPEATRLACQEKVLKKERIYRKKNGSLINVDITSEHFYLADRAVHISAIRDITKHKQDEKALRESEERFRTLMENIDAVAVQGYGADGTTQYWNKASERLYGYSQQEAIGRNLLDLIIPSEIKGAVAEQMREMAESGQPIPSGELLLLHKDGSRVPVISHHTIVKVPGREQELFCLDVDITERKKAEEEREKLREQLNQAQKMESVGRLAGGVAHDYNNMLGVILGHTELALLQADENHDLHIDLKEIQKAAKRSADITKQLLAFARKQTISPKQIDLNDTVESMLNMLRRLIGEDIDLIWKPTAHLWPMKMDPSQIDQILVNLCVNARDAIAGVGQLTIETGRNSFDEEYCNEHPGFIPGDFVLLTVSDNGCGMDKDTLDNLFEPFFTTKEVGKGTGLGLATIYGIVKQNNGFVKVYSEPDQGAVFKIYLPRLFTSEDTDMVVPEKESTDGGTETILLVEDELSILKITERMLERKGYAVLSATTPKEAMEKAKNHSGSIELLMTDVVMPEMNGRDLAEKVTDLYPNTQILFMSGYTSDVIAHQGVLNDGLAFIQKPFSMADLLRKVRDVLDTALDIKSD